MKILKWLEENFEKTVCTFFASVMLLSLFLQVVSRYVFGRALPWTEEVAVISFIMSVYFGATYAVKVRGHITIEILTSAFSEKVQHILGIVANGFFILFSVIILFGFRGVIANLLKYGSVMVITRIPKSLLYSVLPFCFVLMILRLIQDSFRHVREIKELKSSVEETEKTDDRGSTDGI